MNHGSQILSANRAKVLVRLVTMAFLVLPATFSQTASAQDESAWTEDLDHLVESIRNIHPNPYGVIPAAEFDDSVAHLKRRLPELPDHVAAMETLRLVAMLGDGHSEFEVGPECLRGRWIPLIIRRFDEGWFVRTGDARYRELFGKPITHIASKPIHEVVATIEPYVSGENAIGKLDDIGNFMRNAAILNAVGIIDEIPENISITVLENDGSDTESSVRITDESWVGPTWIDVDKLLNPDVDEPLYRRLDGNFDCAWMPDERLLYVMFSEVRDDDDVTIEAFFGNVYEFARRTNPQKFVLDLRENSGGNLDLNGPVLRGLIATPALDQPGKFFVIIGQDTYSAAMNLAVLLERHTHALFVGQPTGASPNHYGDTLPVKLPHSGLRFEISELAWQNSDPRDHRPWITPDIPVELSAAHFIAGRDLALQAILHFNARENPLVQDFGPPMARWRRANQLTEEIWPALLEPAARALAPVEPRAEPRILDCQLKRQDDG